MSGRRVGGGILFLLGAWGLVVPQANLGLPALRWMSRGVFPGEALVGILILIAAYWLLAQRTEP
jgi:hypothetical protein